MLKLQTLKHLFAIAEREIDLGCPHLEDGDIDNIIDTMSRALSQEKPISVARVCRMLGLSKSTLYRRIKEGKLPPGHKLEGEKKHYWYKSELDRIKNKTPTTFTGGRGQS